MKSSFTKIWDGLAKLPGHVKKGLEGKTNENWPSQLNLFGFGSPETVDAKLSVILTRKIVKLQIMGWHIESRSAGIRRLHV